MDIGDLPSSVAALWRQAGDHLDSTVRTLRRKGYTDFEIALQFQTCVSQNTLGVLGIGLSPPLSVKVGNSMALGLTDDAAVNVEPFLDICDAMSSSDVVATDLQEI